LVGVPLIIPLWLKLRPAGKVPDRIVHEYGSVPPEAVSVAEYAVPTMPLGNEAVVIATGVTPALKVMEKGWLAVCTGEEESVTWALKLNLPAPVGVPLMVPLLLNVIPAGKAPETTVHEYGYVPPEAASVVEYVVPTIPVGRANVVTATPFRGLILMGKTLCAVCAGLEESETCPVKLNRPEAAGMPLTTPVVLDNDNPVGNVPETTVK
jgi:hypothetical protein